MEISGIKCDAPGCGYRDDAVKREEYPDYINRPCPKCASNLLTQKDYSFVVALEKWVAFFEKWFFWLPGKKKIVRVELNGTGKAKITEIK